MNPLWKLIRVHWLGLSLLAVVGITTAVVSAYYVKGKNLSSSADGSVLSAAPNPITVCPGAPSGSTTLSWNIPATIKYELYQGAYPGGTVIAQGAGSGQKGVTGTNNGSVYSLVGITVTTEWQYKNRAWVRVPVETRAVLSSLQVKHTTQGCISEAVPISFSVLGSSQIAPGQSYTLSANQGTLPFTGMVDVKSTFCPGGLRCNPAAVYTSWVTFDQTGKVIVPTLPNIEAGIYKAQIRPAGVTTAPWSNEATVTVLAKTTPNPPPPAPVIAQLTIKVNDADSASVTHGQSYTLTARVGTDVYTAAPRQLDYQLRICASEDLCGQMTTGAWGAYTLDGTGKVIIPIDATTPPGIYKARFRPRNKTDWQWSNELSISVAAPVVVTPPNGDATINAYGISIGTTQRAAGAIESLMWGGKEFINKPDHGRQFQFAFSFDENGECYNPTEAGNIPDGLGPTSSSRLRSIKTTSNSIETETDPAFWVPPGGSSLYCKNGFGHALNTSIVSDYKTRKKVTIGYQNIPNVIEYLTTITIPRQHSKIIAQAPTVYLTGEFPRVYGYDVVNRVTVPLTSYGGPDRQPMPLILSTVDGRYALGVFCPELPDNANKGYGLISVPGPGGPNDDATNNPYCSFTTDNPGSSVSYRGYVIVGSLEQVKQTYNQLVPLFGSAVHSGDRFPVGHIDSVSEDGIVTGWVLDPDQTNIAQTARVYVDGVAWNPAAKLAGAGPANLPSPQSGYPGNHGFRIQIPEEYSGNRIITAHWMSGNNVGYTIAGSGDSYSFNQ